MRNSPSVKRLVLLTLWLFVSSLTGVASAFTPSEGCKFSVLTCTPGPDLYSLFGHSALRFQDTLDGRIIDWVYNYGTFHFTDDFYVKFARGKLDYMLSKEDFSSFQEEYLFTGRGISEQEILFSYDEKVKLLALLEENYLPENRTYRYDFFYDNCSTRLRDVVLRASDHPVDFTYVYARPYTFRNAIQTYLDYQPWSDFGIDIALGMPCDRVVEKGQFMFLPDSLLNEFSHAIHNDQPLVLQEEELLPREYELSMDEWFTPLFVFTAILILHVVIGFFFIRRKKLYQFSDRFIFFITGIAGIVVIFLWFFTDHTATRWNLNILWANPLNLILVFLPARFLFGKWKTYLAIYFFILSATLLFWFALPQRLHLAIIPVIFALLFTTLKILRPQMFLGTKSREV